MVDGEQHPQQCPHCTHCRTIESVQHVMTACPLYDGIREQIHSGLQRFCPTAYLHFRQADQRTQTVLLLRDDFWSNEAPPNEVRAPMHLVDAFLISLMNLRDAFLKTM